MVYNFFDKKAFATGTQSGTLRLGSVTRNKFAISGFKNQNISNKELAEQLHKPIIKIFTKRKVQSSFMDNIQDADFADMQLVNEFNKGFRCFISVIDIYIKYAWVIPLEDKKSLTITNTFQKTLTESNWKPNKIWVDKDTEFYN